MNKAKDTSAFSVGDHVSYKQNGIYSITDIRRENIGGFGERDYYVLESAFGGSTLIYVPMDNEKLVSGMSHVITVGEINSIIDETEELDVDWIEDGKQRAQYFNELIANGTKSDILSIIRALMLHRISVESQKKKFYSSDEKLLASAEHAILEEFAFVLGCKVDEVMPYIIKRVRKKEEANG